MDQLPNYAVNIAKRIGKTKVHYLQNAVSPLARKKQRDY